jgi:hypothetical protein
VPARPWSERIASTRLGFEVGKYVTFGSVVSMGFFAMLVGGVHGLVIASGFGAVFGIGVGTLAVLVGAAADGTRALGEALGYTVATGTVEEHAGQLSMTADSRDPVGDGEPPAGRP